MDDEQGPWWMRPPEPPHGQPPAPAGRADGRSADDVRDPSDDGSARPTEVLQREPGPDRWTAGQRPAPWRSGAPAMPAQVDSSPDSGATRMLRAQPGIGIREVPPEPAPEDEPVPHDVQRATAALDGGGPLAVLRRAMQPVPLDDPDAERDAGPGAVDARATRSGRNRAARAARTVGAGERARVAGERVRAGLDDVRARIAAAGSGSAGAPGGGRPQLPGGRRPLLVVAAAVALVVLVGLFRWALPEDGGDDTPVAAERGGGRTATDTRPADLARVRAADASRALRRAGQDRGTVTAAYGWSDENGRNLVAATTEQAPDGLNLYVVHLAGEEGDEPETLRLMQDPGLPGCAGAAGFTDRSFQVRDLDRDGIAEVTIGWFSRCGARTANSTAKLALITGGDKYILRGEGVIGEPGSGTPNAEPSADDWPDEYLTQARKLFRQLYF